MTGTTGGCRCGATRYALTGATAAPPVYLCHCLECQTSSGGAFGQYALLPEGALAVEGPVASIDDVGATGTVVTRHECGDCHTALYKRNPAAPGRVILLAGTLDASDGLVPFAHLFTRRMQPWLSVPDGVAGWPGAPTPEQFVAALAAHLDATP